MVRLGGDINGIELDSGDVITLGGDRWTCQGDWGIIDPAKNGYPGDGSGGDIMDLFRANPNATFALGGTYSVQSELVLEGDVDWDRLAVIGKPHATLVVEDPTVNRTFRIGQSSDGFGDLALQNLTLQVDGANNLDAGWGRFSIGGHCENKNLTLNGRRDRVNTANPGDRFTYYCNVVEESGSAIHQNITLPDGDTPDGSLTQQDHTIPFGSEPPHVGDQRWIDCYAEEYVDNGFYVKDGTGSNTLNGCFTRNCGGAGLRLGESDVAIGCGGVWDATAGTPIYDAGFHGVLLDTDAASGTAVNGFRAIKSSGDNDTVRVRGVAEQATYRDLYINNSTSQHSLYITNGSGDHTDGVIALDGVRIEDSGDDSIRPASVGINRPNVHVRNLSIDTTDSGSNRAPLMIHSGHARVSDSRLVTTGSNYSVIVGDPSGGATVNMASFEGCTLNEGFYMYDNSTVVERLKVDNCDLRGHSSLFPAMSNANKMVFSETDGVTLADVPDGVVVDGDVMESGTTGTPTGSYDTGRSVRTDGWYKVNPDGSFDGPV